MLVGTIHQLKVTLREIHPPVWRRVHGPSEASLAELHEVIQVAMGWEQHPYYWDPRSALRRSPSRPAWVRR
ncbi:hypothetical protein [Streptosporangium sp. NPDC000396]|uniref:IS1096 element passenger TnpR family protein n=1 Tax=Streptosporangium sp. NPDC000396 TaxID=3366185 RepID=UPI003685BF73